MSIPRFVNHVGQRRQSQIPTFVAVSGHTRRLGGITRRPSASREQKLRHLCMEVMIDAEELLPGDVLLLYRNTLGDRFDQHVSDRVVVHPDDVTREGVPGTSTITPVTATTD